MNIKKFVSGISAFAVAVTAFAAMTVTASAKNYTKTILPSDEVYTLVNMTNNGNGTFKANSTGAAGLAVDLTGLENIGKASEVTVSFDTSIPGNSTQIQQAIFGVGDQDIRTLNLGGSSSSYKYSSGLVAFFGATGAVKYQIASEDNIDATNYAQWAVNSTVHVDVTLNRETKAYSVYYEIVGKDKNKTLTGETDLDDLNVIEAFVKGSVANFTLNNITVSYTVPTAPAAGSLEEVTVQSDVDHDGVYAKAYTCDITYDGIAIENVKVDVEGSNEGSQTHTLGHIESNVRIGIILASEDASKIADVTPTVTVNVQ